MLWIRNVYASFGDISVQCTAVYADYQQTYGQWDQLSKNLNVSIDRHNNMAHKNETAEEEEEEKQNVHSIHSNTHNTEKFIN